MHAVAITPVPQLPPIIMGVVDVQGRIIPVINLRLKLGMPQREIALSDQLVIIQLEKRSVAFIVDQVADIINSSLYSLVAANDIYPEIKHLEGGLKVEDGLIFIHKPEQIFSFEEEMWLTEALRQDENNE